MLKNVVIFGGTGGVGAYTVLRLIKHGYHVIVVGHRVNDGGFFEDMGADYFSVDITNNASFNVLPKDNIFAIIHLAGMLPARMNGYMPQLYLDCNITGTLNVLQYAVSVRVERFIYSQSFSDVSYLQGSTIPIPAESESKFPLNNDHSIYSISKTAGMLLTEHFSSKYGFRQFSLRFPNIYLYHPNPTYFVDGKIRVQGLRNIIKQIKNGEDVELWGNPERVRDMVYVKDCCQIIECCLSASASGGTYNVGTGIGTTRRIQIQDLIECFSPKSGKKSSIIFRADMPDSPQYIMDVEKTIVELGYNVEYNHVAMVNDYKKEMELNRFERIWGKSVDF